MLPFLYLNYLFPSKLKQRKLQGRRRFGYPVFWFWRFFRFFLSFCFDWEDKSNTRDSFHTPSQHLGSIFTLSRMGSTFHPEKSVSLLFSGRKAGGASKTKPGLPLSSRSGSATAKWSISDITTFTDVPFFYSGVCKVWQNGSKGELKEDKRRGWQKYEVQLRNETTQHKR